MPIFENVGLFIPLQRVWWYQSEVCNAVKKKFLIPKTIYINYWSVWVELAMSVYPSVCPSLRKIVSQFWRKASQKSVGFDILTSTLGKIIPLIFQNFDQTKKKRTTLSYSCNRKGGLTNVKMIQRPLYFIFGKHTR